MRLIIKIAKNELRNIIYSPVAWFLGIVFWVMCAFFYNPLIDEFGKLFIVSRNHPDLTKALQALPLPFSRNIFAGNWFLSVLQNLYLFIPLLTMSIISRERNGGTIALLYSSPVKLRHIVSGKYLALMVYNLVLVLIMAFFVGSVFFTHNHVDYAPLLSGLLGFYLLLCALAAIGLFMSGLTTYPIVSAIASFTVLFVLMFIGHLWQDHAFIRDLTYFLSIAGRVNKMINGLISTKDLIYYLIIIYIFCGFTLLKLKAGREAKPWYVKAGRYMAVIVSALLMGYISSRPRFIAYLDTTSQQINSLHPHTRQLLQDLGDSTLEVTIYTNIMDRFPNDFMHPIYPKDVNPYLDLWEPYLRYKPNIQFKYAYYFAPNGDSSGWYRTFPGKNLRQIMGLLARIAQQDSILFLSPEEMQKRINLKPEDYATVMQLKYEGRTTISRLLPSATGEIGGISAMGTEPDYIAAFSRLLEKKMPRVAFVSGELERNPYKIGDRDYFKHTLLKQSNRSLINIGFDVDTLHLQTQDIPADVTILVLADPKMELSPVVQRKIRTYIGQGGNMLILGKPGKQYVLNPLLSQMGVRLLPGQIIQPSFNETPDKVSGYFTLPCYDLADENAFLQCKLLRDQLHMVDTAHMQLVGVTGIQSAGDSGFTMKPLLLPDSNRSWERVGTLVVDSTAPAFDPLEGDQKRGLTIAEGLSRRIGQKEQRIVVVGDADFASNNVLRFVSGEFVRAIYTWLGDDTFPVYNTYPLPKERLVIPSSAAWAKVQSILYLWILPGLLLVLGTVLLVRRRRK